MSFPFGKLRVRMTGFCWDIETGIKQWASIIGLAPCARILEDVL